MQDEVDLLNVNEIVSISVNENRLKEVFLMMMTKLNHHAARIYKLQTNYKFLQDTTEKSIYSVQQRIQFNEKQLDNNLSKVYLNINENRSDQEEINGKIQKLINSKERQMRDVKERIEEVGDQLESRLYESSKEFGALSENMHSMKDWKEVFEMQVKDKVEKLREELISVEARVSYSYKPRQSQMSMNLVNQVQKGRQRSSEFVLRKSYMPKGPKHSLLNYNDMGLVSNQALSQSQNQSKTNAYLNDQINTGNQYVKQKLSCIEQELQRQRRIVDKKLVNTIQERVFTDSSRDNNSYKLNQTQTNFRGLKKTQNGEELRKQVLNALREMQGKMNECKVPQEEFDKAIKGINDKIHLLQMLVVNKCQKTQVKNAFSFLQKKLKQLILVVTNNEASQKDGMLTQQPIKCLSCNNFVQKQSKKIDYSYWKIIKGSQLNSFLEMKNDFRNIKTQQGKARLQKKGQASSFHDNSYKRRESKSVIYTNSEVNDKQNK